MTENRDVILLGVVPGPGPVSDDRTDDNVLRTAHSSRDLSATTRPGGYGATIRHMVRPNGGVGDGGRTNMMSTSLSPGTMNER